MRILVINQYFHPDLASTGQLLTELCEDLSREHDVHVVCGRPSYDIPAYGETDATLSAFQSDRITVRRTWSTSFPRQNMAGRLANYATYMISSTWGALTAPKPDVILTMTDPPIVAAVALLTSRVRRVPFVYVCQDIFPDIAVVLGKMKDGLLRKALAQLNRSLRHRATAVVAIGRDMRDQLIALGTPADKIAVIPNWADGSRITPGLGQDFRRRHGWEDRFVVMHSGNVGLSQSLDTLIAAADILRDEQDIVFAIVGAGASKAALQRAAAERGLSNVEFLPYQAKGSLSGSLGAADVHIVGLKEGLTGLIVPSKVYGIMAAGKPFIAATQDTAEPALIIEESGCGITAHPDDPTDLARAINEARASDLRTMGSAGRKAFEERFDRPRAAQAYAALLERVVRDAHL